MKTAIIIMCAGEGKRWEKNLPKQMQLVKGVPNVKRTYNMIIENGFSSNDIFVTVNMENGEFFPTDLNLIVGSSSREIDRFRNGFSIMKDYERTIFLYGDVIYHMDDMTKILSGEGFSFFGRTKPNPLTGKPYGELFGVAITLKEEFIDTIQQVATDYENGIIKSEVGWKVYHCPHNKELKTFHETSMYTDDYDDMIEFNKIIEAFY